MCAAKNSRISAFLAGFFALEVYLCWRELDKTFVELSLYELLFRIVLWSFLIFPVLFRFSKCLPERFILTLLVIKVVTGCVFDYAPNLVEPITGLVRQCDLVLYFLALLASVALLASSLTGNKSSKPAGYS
jgi:hypothetical protein